MFFRLDAPENVGEAEHETKNCCFQDPEAYLSMPGIICHYCETTWSSLGRRLLTDLPLSSYLHEQLSKPRSVPFEEYEAILRILQQELRLPSCVRVLPGTRIGHLKIRCECVEHTEDFIWDSGAYVVVTQRVVDTLLAAKITGYEVHPVHITNVEEITVALPPLYELIVVGKGGPMGPEAGLRLVSECSRCGHRNYETVYYGRSGGYKFQGLYVNLETWDGSDLFTFEDWPTILMITEKAQVALSSAGLSNWRAYPAPLGSSKW